MNFFNTHALNAKTLHPDSSINLPAPWTARAVVLVLLLLVCAGSASAQVSVSWGAFTGSWSTASNWSPAVVPNNSGNTTYSVSITKPLAHVSVGIPRTVDNLVLGSGNALDLFSTLTLVSGTSTNNGTITLIGGDLSLANGTTFNNNSFLSSAFGTIFANGTLNNDGGLGISGGLQVTGTLNNSGGLANTGFLTNRSGATIFNFLSATLENFAGGQLANEAGATINNFGMFTNDKNATINNAGTINLYSGMTNNGTLNNFGTITTKTCLLCLLPPLANSSGASFNNGGTIAFAGSFHNSGAFNNSALDPASGLSTNGTFTLLSGGSFSNGMPSLIGGGPLPGTFMNPGMLDINAGAMFTNGAGSTLDSTGLILVAGTFNNDPGAMVTLNSQPLPPGGSPLSPLSIMSGGVLNNNGTITWSNPGPLQVPAVQINFGGTLMGNGTINGDVMNGGMLNPGNSPGIMTINGNYIQTSGGAYTAELGGVFAGQYDQLNISGSASLAGTLNVTLFNNFVVNLGNSFIILTAGSISGTFGILNLPTICPGLFWTLAYNPTNVTLTVAQTPEPGSLLLFSTGLMACAGFLRRRMHTRL